MTEPKDKLISIEEFKSTGMRKPSVELKKMMDALEMMKAFAGIRADIHKHIAEDKKTQYDAYLTAGFSPEQALILTKG